MDPRRLAPVESDDLPLTAQLVVTPLLFVSFILSLYMVDSSRDTRRRSSWPIPSSSVNVVPTRDDDSAFYRLTRQRRRQIKLNVSDALDMRGRVIAALLALLLLAVLLVYFLLRTVWRWIFLRV